MTARLLVGDVFDRMAELPDHSVDLILTSPPFLALRSYLPDGHPDKAKEIGSEATPAEFLDTLLALTAEWRRLLAPHGSIAIELGDTYAGSGGAGGDYGPDGLRDGQERFDGTASRARRLHPDVDGRHRNSDPDRRELRYNRNENGGSGWPLDKSLTGIPTLYTWSLAYGRNLLTGQPSPAGMWRIRNLKPWIRSNPPVGALGDKERPATSYITVATLTRDRWFDLDAVRTTPAAGWRPRLATSGTKGPNLDRGDLGGGNYGVDPAGAPPLDWWHHVDAVIDAEIDRRAGKPISNPAHSVDTAGAQARAAQRGRPRLGPQAAGPVGAQGKHIRRALEAAGILTTHDALDVSPKGYAGAHYAVWPPELCRQLIDEMCPRHVCTTCGQPRRRIVGEATYVNSKTGAAPTTLHSGKGDRAATRIAPTLGWSDCGHETWRPGHILDPFAGSGTTLAVATGMARTATGIDLDESNAALAVERCGMFLEIDHGTEGVVA